MLYTLLLNLFISLFFTDPIARISFESGSVQRNYSPIYFDIDLDLREESGYYLENISDGSVYPIQVLPSGLLTMIPDFPAHTTLIFDIKKGDITIESMASVDIRKDPDGIQVTVANMPLLFYQSETKAPEGNMPGYYNRSGFIHPLYSPNGEILTDGFPIGHTHQNAIFNAWTNTTYKETKVDFWNRQEQLGTVKHTEIISTEEGKIKSQIKTILSHISLDHGEILEEKWQIDIYPTEKYFLFDLRSEQVNTSQDTLFLHEYLYGGMAYRGSKEWNRDDTLNFTNTWEILTNEGLTGADANHTKAAWVNASGMINGNRAGLAVFSFPDNFRAPQMIRVHPEMPYWVYSPVVEGSFFIAPGKKYISRYRYLCHDGDIDATDLDRIQADLEYPVIVRRLE